MEVASGAGVLTVRASTQFWRELPSAESTSAILSWFSQRETLPCSASVCFSTALCLLPRSTKPSSTVSSRFAISGVRDISPLQNAERLRTYERVTNLRR